MYVLVVSYYAILPVSSLMFVCAALRRNKR